MDSRPDFSQNRFTISHSKKLPIRESRVDVIVINSRYDTHRAWVDLCFNSIKGQTYTNLGIVEVWNTSCADTIGKCWNEAVKRSTANYVMFVGDDDIIHPTLVHDLAHGLKRAILQNPAIVAISSFMTMIDQDAKTLGRMENPFTGMYLRKTLLENPFNEDLKNNVDTELMNRYRAAGLHIAHLHHNFGYYYRRHKDMVSGESRFETKMPENG